MVLQNQIVSSTEDWQLACGWGWCFCVVCFYFYLLKKYANSHELPLPGLNTKLTHLKDFFFSVILYSTLNQFPYGVQEDITNVLKSVFKSCAFWTWNHLGRMNRTPLCAHRWQVVEEKISFSLLILNLPVEQKSLKNGNQLCFKKRSWACAEPESCNPTLPVRFPCQVQYSACCSNPG